MTRIYTFTYWVYDAKGEIVTNYARQADAAKHAARIGGTWRKGRL